MANPLVIDISHWNEEPDWNLLKMNGTIGVILKATQGTTYVDPTYAERCEEALEAGLMIASYHFMESGNISGQMEHFLNTVGPDDGERMILDFEEDPSGVDPTFDDLEEAAEYLLAGGMVNVAVYGSGLLMAAVEGKTSSILEKTSLWQARYSTSEPEVPTNIWKDWDLWQYTQTGRPVGTFTDTDCNKWNIAAGDVHLWFNSNAYDPVPAPKPDTTVATVFMNIAVETDKPVKLNISVNGRPVDVVSIS